MLEGKNSTIREGLIPLLEILISIGKILPSLVAEFLILNGKTILSWKKEELSL